MHTHFIGLLGLAGLTALGACGGASAVPACDDTAAASPATLLGDGRYFVARRDPEGGGYLLREVNRDVPARHVAALDVTTANLDPGATRAVDEAPDGDLVVRGSFPSSDAEDLVVEAAYRGLPGMAPAPGDAFFVVRDREPPIACSAAPGEDPIASRLDTGDTSEVTAVSVARAAAPWVDQAWLVARVRLHGAVVAAQLRDGVLDVGQVFLPLPDHGGPCLLIRHVCDPPLQAAYTRDVNRCVTFDRCAAPHPCSFVRPACPEGYRRVSWPADNATCMGFACDPAFLAE